MPEEEFWKTSPRKLNALLELHARLNGAGDEEVEESKQRKGTDTKKTGYIDQVLPFM